MGDFLTDFLASILQEEGVTNAREVAAKAAADLRKARFVDQRALARIQIQADPCRDYKVIMRRYHVPQVFVYRVWRSLGFSGDSQSQEA